MPFLQRLAIVLGLWLIAGVLCAIFAKGSVDCGESEFVARLQMVCFAPIISAAGIAFTVIRQDFSPWEQRNHFREITFWIVVACIGAHAIFTLTRRDRRQFIGLVTVEAVFLLASVSCSLFMYGYWDANGHG
jgi:ABC-type thiamin/hydroxymethylpyrimidine transport system permease subunit